YVIRVVVLIVAADPVFVLGLGDVIGDDREGHTARGSAVRQRRAGAHLPVVLGLEDAVGDALGAARIRRRPLARLAHGGGRAAVHVLAVLPGDDLAVDDDGCVDVQHRDHHLQNRDVPEPNADAPVVI